MLLILYDIGIYDILTRFFLHISFITQFNSRKNQRQFAVFCWNTWKKPWLSPTTRISLGLCFLHSFISNLRQFVTNSLYNYFCYKSLRLHVFTCRFQDVLRCVVVFQYADSHHTSGDQGLAQLHRQRAAQERTWSIRLLHSWMIGWFAEQRTQITVAYACSRLQLETKIVNKVSWIDY